MKRSLRLLCFALCAAHEEKIEIQERRTTYLTQEAPPKMKRPFEHANLHLTVNAFPTDASAKRVL